VAQVNITPALLQNLNVTYHGLWNDTYSDLLNSVPIFWQDLAEEIPSDTIEDVFGWMKGISGYRQWIGDREIEGLDASSYTIVSKKYEKTLGIPRDNIKYDKLGLYAPMFKAFGGAARTFRDELLWPLIASGASNVGPDGQYFYDTDHPLTDSKGQTVTYSNYITGAGPLWLLVARPYGIKPFILTKQEELDFVPLVDPTAPNVFIKDEYLWGSKGRFGTGYFLWQLVQAMTTAVAEPYFSQAFTALATRMGDKGRLMPMIPAVAYFPYSMRADVNQTLLAEKLANGASNTNFKVVDIQFVPYLDAIANGWTGVGT
jgi:phage major head subunit gpT-like protein